MVLISSVILSIEKRGTETRMETPKVLFGNRETPLGRPKCALQGIPVFKSDVTQRCTGLSPIASSSNMKSSELMNKLATPDARSSERSTYSRYDRPFQFPVDAAMAHWGQIP